MRKELKRYSTIGNREGILLLCEKVLTGKSEDLASIRLSCSFKKGVELNFVCGIMALEDIDLLKSDGKSCIGNKIVYKKNSPEKFEFKLCNYCLKKLIEDGYIEVEEIHFDEEKRKYYIPKHAFKMECAIYRNLLISLGALEYSNSLFFISLNYESIFYNTLRKKRKKKNQQDLLKELEKERIMGEEGEKFALLFEKDRCNFSIKQLNNIKQISLIDVSAGFDIISYESENEEERRYIEVKTYSKEIHFYWSVNEMSSAQLRGEHYYIYLIDYSLIRIPGYQPYIIKNPYKEIGNVHDWTVLPQSYLVEPKGKLITPEIHINEDKYLRNINTDTSILAFINNRIVFNDDCNILSLVKDCQIEYGIKYNSMKRRDWYYLIDNYIKTLSGIQINEDEGIREHLNKETIDKLKKVI